MKTIRLTQTLAKQQGMKYKKATDAFYSTHIKGNHDILSIVLKSHLYVEFIIDEILKLVLINPNKILKKRFSDKIDLFESLDLVTPDIYKKLRILNGIRNKFSHDLNYSFTRNDFSDLRASNEQNKPNVALLKFVDFLIGYLHAFKGVYETIPFVFTCAKNKAIFNRDVNFKKKNIINKKNLSKVIKFLEQSKIK